jgi:hypothetical protein
MALLGNYSVYHKLPDKFLTGTTLYGDRANFNKPGMMRSMGAGSGNDWTLAAIPKGFGAGGAWMLPKTAGAMTSRRMARIVIDGTGSVREGSIIVGTGLLTINGSGDGELITWSYIIGSSTITISAYGTGGTLISATGSAIITIDGLGAIKAILGAIGSSVITISALMNTGAAPGWIAGDGLLTIIGDGDPIGIGWMEGTTAEGGLTPAGIANAVWNAIAASLNATGTMGEKMNAAGAAGDPWLTTLPGAYIPGTAGDIIGNQIPDIQALTEFLFNIEGGKWKIVGNQMIFYEADNTTEVARFNLFDSAGNPAMTNVYERRRT